MKVMEEGVNVILHCLNERHHNNKGTHSPNINNGLFLKIGKSSVEYMAESTKPKSLIECQLNDKSME